MSDDLELVEADPDLRDMPSGYVYDKASVDEAELAYSAASGPLLEQWAGSTKKMIDQGITYFNLMKYPADLLRRPNMSGIITSQRKLLDCGTDGAVLEPYGQGTGICNGCSHSMAPFITACWNYVLSGGPIPKEYTFIGPYLAGRDMGMISRGDTGSIPPITIRVMHDVGSLPVDCGGPYDFTKMPPHGPKSQESVAVALRDNPKWLPEWVESAANHKSRVLPTGRDAWMVADTISNGRCVTKGAGYQINSPVVGDNGVSGIYSLGGGGHETLFCGWAIVGGRLMLITLESWWNVKFPGAKWLGYRVLLKHDKGANLLYPGQGAVDAASYVNRCTELWGVDYPGSR